MEYLKWELIKFIYILIRLKYHRDMQYKEILLNDTIKINIDLHSGKASAIAWGCDLTYDYVKINGDYRS